METRTCTKCGEVKPLNDFIRNVRLGVAKKGPCLICNAKRVSAWELANKQRAKTARAAYDKTPERKNRRSIRNVTTNSVRRGKLPHPTTLPCVDCDRPATEYDHHNGYSKASALDVQPVCKTCQGKRRIARGENVVKRKAKVKP